MARRNGGIREPEQRLWLYIACSLGLMTGLLLWGVGSGHIHWFGVLFGAFLLGFTGVLGGASPIAYISDSYPMVRTAMAAFICAFLTCFSFLGKV